MEPGNDTQIESKGIKDRRSEPALTSLFALCPLSFLFVVDFDCRGTWPTGPLEKNPEP